MDSQLLKEVIKNQRKMLKEVQKIDRKCNQIELCQNTLFKKIMGKEFDLMEMALEEMKKVTVFYDKAIKKYDISNLSISNLDKQCKKTIKHELKYDEISKCTKKLTGDMKIIEDFLNALTPNEENYALEESASNLWKELENYLNNYDLHQTNHPHDFSGN